MNIRNQEIDNNDPKVFDIVFDGYSAHVSVHVIKSAKVFHVADEYIKICCRAPLRTGNTFMEALQCIAAMPEPSLGCKINNI